MARWLALGLIGVAFCLRVYRLPDQNVWFDEGWSTWLARMDLASITFRTAADTHPPLHYWLLHGWGLAAGTNAFTARLFSVFCGTLTVAVIYRAGQQAGGPRLGALAALALALSRFAIWWSQEIRDYALAGLFGLCAVWLTLRLVSSGAGAGARGRLWAGYILASLAAVYSHYLAWLLFLGNNLLVAGWLVARWRRGPFPGRPLAQWSLAQLAVLAAFAPWLTLHLDRAMTRFASPLPDFGFYLRLAASLFTVGATYNIEAQAVPVAALLMLAAAGALWALRGRADARGLNSRAGRAALLSLLLLALPTVVIYLLALTPAAIFVPQVSGRYLLIFLPGFCLLTAFGLFAIARRSRPAGLAVVAIFITIQVFGLRDYYQARRLRDDYTTLANVVNSFAQPGDVLLLHTDHEWPVALYYLRKPIPWEGVLARQPVSPEYAAGLAEALIQNNSRVWLLTVPDALEKDPQHLVAAELARRLPIQFEQGFDAKQLTLFAPNPEPALSVPAANFYPQHRRLTRFQAGPTLLGFDLPITEARGGDVVRLVTYWDAPASQPVTVALRGRDGVEAMAVTADVPAGQKLRLQTDLRLPLGAVGLFSVAVRSGGQTEDLGLITAVPLGLTDASDLDQPTNYQLGGLVRLAGFTLGQPRAKAGGQVSLVLFWSSLQPAAQDYKVFVHLVGAEFNPKTNNPLWGQVDRLPLDGSLPMPVWPPGEVIRDAYLVPVDPDALPGSYALEVGLYDPLTGERLLVTTPEGSVSDHIPLAVIEVTP